MHLVATVKPLEPACCAVKDMSATKTYTLSGTIVPRTRYSTPPHEEMNAVMSCLYFVVVLDMSDDATAISCCRQPC